MNTGHDVVFVERLKTAAILHESGLNLNLGDREVQIPSPIIKTEIHSVIRTQRFDFAVYALKSFDTEGFLLEVAGIEEAFPPILCLSNGVDNEPMLIDQFGEDSSR